MNPFSTERTVRRICRRPVLYERILENDYLAIFIVAVLPLAGVTRTM